MQSDAGRYTIHSQPSWTRAFLHSTNWRIKELHMGPLLLYMANHEILPTAPILGIPPPLFPHLLSPLRMVFPSFALDRVIVGLCVRRW